MPPSFSGNDTFEIFDKGQQDHEMAVSKIVDGKTLADVQGFLASTEPPAGPPPITPSGGIPAAAPGTSTLATLDLTAGNDVMVCFLPDTETGAPHFTLGMIQPFTVSSPLA